MGLRGKTTIGSGQIEAHKGQSVQHVHAGTKGRLLRLCMNVARNHPEWWAEGQIEEYKDGEKTAYRQKLVRREIPQ